jgi:DNA-binding response OmpR family regulator
MRILVVDDHRDSAESLALLLTRRGFDLDVSFDGPEALEACARFRPDVVLLDLRLPVLDGFEVCRRIREWAWGGDVFIIAHTGLLDDNAKRLIWDAGFDAHLVKPLDHVAFRRLLSELPRAPRSAGERTP